MAEKGKVDKMCKKDYTVKDKTATDVGVNEHKTDAGGTFYVYNLFDKDGVLIALDRYVYVDSEEQPFDKLSKAEEDSLKKPKIEDVEKTELDTL